jgi:hypothetical protein
MSERKAIVNDLNITDSLQINHVAVMSNADYPSLKGVKEENE